MLSCNDKYRRDVAPDPQEAGNEDSSFPDRSSFSSIGINPNLSGTGPNNRLFDKFISFREAMSVNSSIGVDERFPSSPLSESDSDVTSPLHSPHVTPYQSQTLSALFPHP